MRIISLLPSATEICFALGLGDHLVGVTHECDYPPAAVDKLRITRSKADESFSSREIDLIVRSQLDQTGSIYELDLDTIELLSPDVILTQRLCTVCAVSFDYVKETAKRISSSPRVINLEPRTIDEMLESIILVGSICNKRDHAQQFVSDLRNRINVIRERCSQYISRSVLFLEWIDPPFASGHWIPELIELAGGKNTVAYKHTPSRQVSWDMINRSRASVIVVGECGFGVDRQKQDLSILLEHLTYKPEEIWIADGSQYFSRPGPRLVESLEILAGIIHPELRSEYHKPFYSRKEIEQVVPVETAGANTLSIGTILA